MGLFMAAGSASSTCTGASPAFPIVHPPRPIELSWMSRAGSRSDIKAGPRLARRRHRFRTATTSAGWLDVLKHKPLPTRGVTTAVRSAHPARPLRPACCSWKGAVGRSATAFPANRWDQSWAPVLRRLKAPLQAVSEKNSSPKNSATHRGLYRSCISSSASRDFGRKYGMLRVGPNRHRNEAPSNIPNNMKGRALSFENHMDFCSTDPP